MSISVEEKNLLEGLAYRLMEAPRRWEAIFTISQKPDISDECRLVKEAMRDCVRLFDPNDRSKMLSQIELLRRSKIETDQMAAQLLAGAAQGNRQAGMINR